MDRWLKELRKYLVIYGLFVKNCLMAQMEYRVNFLMGILVECAFQCIKILYVIVVYQTGIVINGLSPDGILFFVGTYNIMTGILCAFFFFNFTKISEYVRDGSLDIFITKPISLQFMVTLRYVDFGTPIPNLLSGFAMVAIAWNRLGIDVGWVNLGGYALFMGSSVVLTYALILFPSLLSFWTVKTQAIYDITYALWDFNNMPMGIYSKWITRIGVYVIPIFVITNFPPLFVLGRMSLLQAAWALICPVVLMVLVRLFWNHAVRNYTSASS